MQRSRVEDLTTPNESHLMPVPFIERCLNSIRSTSVIFFFLAAVGFVTTCFGFIPFYTFVLGIPLWQLGFAEGLVESGFLHYPQAMGQPVGAPIVFGAPFSYVTAVFIKLGLQGPDAYGFCSILFLCCALAGFVWLVHRLGGDTVTGILGGTAYLTLPFVWYHAHYGALAYAFALLPTYFVIAWWTLDTTTGESTFTAKAAATLAFLLTAVFAAFMDGYTFIMFFVVASIMVIAELIPLVKNQQLRPVIRTLIVFSMAFSTAAVLYIAYVPANQYPLPPLSVFRAMGVDLYTTLIPKKGVYFIYDLLGYSQSYSSNDFYGDQSAITANFLGLSAILGIAGIIFYSIPKKLKFILVAIALIGFLLSLGPSLKFNSKRSINANNHAHAEYTMPKSKAILNLGTGMAYKILPGLKFMRATYRWFILVHMVFIILSIIVLIKLKSAKKMVLYWILACLLIMGHIPSSFNLKLWHRDYITFKIIHKKFIGPLKSKLQNKEKIFFWPDGNDFAVNYFAPELKIRAYNVGGDKNNIISRKEWPPALKQKDTNGCMNTKKLYRLFSENKLNAIVATNFDMLWDVHHPWPLPKSTLNAYRNNFKKCFDSKHFNITTSQYFELIKPLKKKSLQSAY